jgi:hypothetical protein
MRNERGATLLFTFIVMITLIAIVGAFLYMTYIRTKSTGYDVASSTAFWAAEAGLQYGTSALKADRSAAYQTSNPAASGYSDVVYLEGYQSGGLHPAKYGVHYERACLHGTDFTDPDPSYAILKSWANAEVQVWDFQQRFNLIGTPIHSLAIVFRAIRWPAQGDIDPIIQLQYSPDGGTTWYNAGSEIAMDTSDWGAGSYRTVDITSLAGVPTDWSGFINNNFKLRAIRTNEGNRNCRVDWLALKATIEVDALTEPWGSSSYATFPYTLGDGAIQSITISDESAKLHLNYAGQDVLRYLAEECGFTAAQAATFAQEVIDYRSTDYFDYIEALMRLPSMTQQLYNLIRDYVTVYSWVNNQVTRPTGSRAPVNVNSADVKVLKAIFRTVVSSTRADALANYIVTQRATAPFTHLGSSYAYHNADTKSFLYYLCTLPGTVLSDAYSVAENADASFYNSTLTDSWNGNDESATEFCYYSNTFLVNAVGQDDVIQRTVKATYGMTYDYTNFRPNTTFTDALPAYIGQTASAYWKEVGN